MPKPQKQAAHPGMIVFMDGDLNKEVSTMIVDDTIPESVCFAPDTNGVLVPVVKVVAYEKEGGQKAVHEFSEDGSCLRTTTLISSSTDR